MTKIWSKIIFKMARSIHERAEFLGDAIFAASDGIVTTFAIVAGSAGASLTKEIVLILGFANLFADGFSMASGRYLAVKSEIEYEKAKGKNETHEGSPLRHALITFVAFDIAGLVSLIPFVLGLDSPYVLSTILVGLALFTVGFLRSFYTKKNFITSGVEMFTVGGFAAFVAFFVGYLLEHFVLKKP